MAAKGRATETGAVAGARFVRPSLHADGQGKRCDSAPQGGPPARPGWQPAFPVEPGLRAKRQLRAGETGAPAISDNLGRTIQETTRGRGVGHHGAVSYAATSVNR